MRAVSPLPLMQWCQLALKALFAKAMFEPTVTALQARNSKKPKGFFST
jgi:hypothetical protein